MVVKCSCAGGELDGSDSSPLYDLSFYLENHLSLYTIFSYQRGIDEKFRMIFAKFLPLLRHIF